MDKITPVTPEKTFSNMLLLPEILATLTKNEINIPTPIQAQGIPVALENKDIVGIAQTGTGKTLAFGLPTLQKIKKEGGHALIMVPTRELAYQVYESMKPYANSLQIGMIVIVGGEPIFKQKRAIRMRPSIVIATPGRLNDHLRQKSIILSGVKTLILDEADQMLDMGFKPQIEEAIAFIPKERQTMLFSATMAKSILDLATKYMNLPLHIEVAPAGTAAKNVEQEIFIVHRDEKHALLQTCLEQHKGKALVFCRTKHGCTKLTKYLTDKAFSAAEIHGNRSLSQRKFALQNFKNGTVRILVATDIAARGIHVDNIECVINFDLPEDSEDYVHRIGRTARAGTKGKAISFATADQHGKIRGIEKLMRMTIPKGKMPDTFTKVESFDRAPQRSSSGGRGGFGGGRGGSRGGFGGGRGGNSRPGGGSSFGSRPPRKFSGNRDGSFRNKSR